MVPATCAADLDNIDVELFEQGCHPRQFLRSAGRISGLFELIAEDPGDLAEAFLPAHGAGFVARLPVELGRLQQMGLGVADVGNPDPASMELREQRPPLQRVVHNRPFGPHDHRVRAERELSMRRSGQVKPGVA